MNIETKEPITIDASKIDSNTVLIQLTDGTGTYDYAIINHVSLDTLNIDYARDWVNETYYCLSYRSDHYVAGGYSGDEWVKKHWWQSSSGRIEFQLPIEAIEDCRHQGACDDNVEYWQKKLNLNLDRQLMSEELKEYGAWEIEELNELSNEELEQKLVWIAAGDIQESDDWEK